MSDFAITRDRDAWSVIRGFVYQVELTIDRWLRLQPDQVLELERGEDIDTIQRAMESAGEEQARLLEQIKVREDNLTLRSDAARAALASFFEHYQANLDLNLNFRYVTNARIGTERNSPAPGGVPLIGIWEQIRSNSLDQQQETFYLQIIREFLIGSSKPADLNENTWEAFVDFIRSAPDMEVFRLIRNVEWLTEQVDTADIAAQLQHRIASQYSMSVEQADDIHSRLFLYVFKRLSSRGIKRLTHEDLNQQIALPALNASDYALLNQLSVFIKNLDNRVATLEGQMSDLRQQRVVEISSDELREACRKVTSNSINRIIESQRPVVRRQIRNGIELLVTSATRYLFLVGSSGVGKSTTLAIEAKHLMERGWAVLLLTVLPGELFTVDHAAELIGQQLPSGSTSVEWHQIVRQLVNDVSLDSLGFVIMLDALADADIDHIAQQFTLLDESLLAASLDRVKVISSCRDVELGDLLRNPQMPFFVNAEDVQRATARGYKVTTLGDFNSEELDGALSEIGAVELLSPERLGDRVDPHIATLRDLLKHPGTFEHYASLHASGDVSSLQNVTWSGLIERRLNYTLREAERISQASREDLLGELVSFAELCRRQRARDFLIDSSEVNDRLPGWFEMRHGSSGTAYEVLISCGVLLEQAAPENRSLTGFRITDAGAYLLSFRLEREITDLSDEAVREIVKGWISEAWNYSSLLDAVLALIDRLSVTPRSPRLLLLLETILETHRYASLFRLMSPAVLGSLFELLKRDHSERPYKYRKAAVEVRPSSEALQIVRRHLRDINAEARRLAAKLAGQHRDEESIPELIRLLEDEDKDVRREAFGAFGFIGKPAIPLLMDALDNIEKSEEVRSRYVTALRNTGFRDEEVTAALGEILSAAQNAGETNLLRSALLAAARLRDRGHTEAAVEALRHSDEVAQAAAKLLTEVPDQSALPALLDALRPQTGPDGEPVNRYGLTSQLMAALHRTDPVTAEPELVEILRQGLTGVGELSETQVVNAAQKLELPSAYPLILNSLVSELKQQPPHNRVWHTSEALGSAWRTNQLDALTAEAETLLAEGTDIARLFVDSIQPNIREHGEFRMGDRLNRAQDLQTVIKCRAVNFGSEAGRLLEQASSLSTEELCRYLWLAGDIRAEDFLLAKLEEPLSEGEHAELIQSAVMLALGTCGAARGTEAVLNYLRSDENISLYFPQETLHPLLQRGLITPATLSEIASNARNSSGGRANSLIALAEFDARGHTELFIRLVNDEDELVQLHAVRLLGFTSEASAVDTLRQLLLGNWHSGLKAQAAEALGWLNARDAVHDIEDAFEDAEDDADITVARFVNALSRFRAQSSLPLLLRRFQSAPRHIRRYYLEVLGAFSHEPQGEQVLLDQFEECITGPNDFFDNQSSLIEGLVEYAPEMLLERFNVHFDRGRLTTGGRLELARSVIHIFRSRRVDLALLLQTMKRLVCDHDISVRDRASHALRFMDAPFCQQLYDELRQGSQRDEWMRACSVWTLGYWDSDLAEIESARYAQESTVRLAADEALLLRKKHSELDRHLHTFSTADGVARVASYLCLLKQGNLSTIWRLHDSISEHSLANTFVHHLTDRIGDRLKDEYRKRQEKLDKFCAEQGTVYFD
jgi:HEAT repeat protein